MEKHANHKSLTEQLDDAILENACPLLDGMIKTNRREKNAKRNGYFYGNDAYEVKSYEFLDAHSGNLLPYMFKDMDFMDILHYLFYILDGRSKNPENKYNKYNPAKVMWLIIKSGLLKIEI